MSMKSQGYMMALMAIAAMSENVAQSERGERFIPDTEETKKLLKRRQEELLRKKGVKEFTIDGETVNARDYTNALRKVNNLKKNKT